jgi:transposase InsO family protein
MYEADSRMKVALFRYGVIAPLACPRLEPDEAKQKRRYILAQLFEYPDGSRRPVPERTLRHWLQKYRKFGFQGLFDEFRSDKGTSKTMSAELLKKAGELRKEEPARSVRTVIELLRKGGSDTSTLSERTVARRLTAIGATKQLLKKGAGTYQRWEQLHVNDLWQGDTSHGVWLRDPEDPSKAKKTKFIIFVDDASRVCTHGEFYFDEQLPRLLDCFGKALLTRGLPCRLLFDNGSIYRSDAIRAACAELGSEISFCRPRAPQGKGKVERFIKTVQDSFMVEANRAAVESLDALNTMFAGWLKEYHNRVHSELDGKTPADRWKEDIHRISIVTPDQLKRALMLRAKRRVHINTAIVSVEGVDYQASPDLAGQEVEVRWSLQNTEEVELWMLGVFVETAKEFQIKNHVDVRHRRIDEDVAPGTPVESSKKLMQGYQSSHPEHTLEAAGANDLLAMTEFVGLFFKILNRALVQEELDALGTFFRRVAPVRRDVVSNTLSRATQVKGGDLHLRFYLEQLEQAIRGGSR